MDPNPELEDELLEKLELELELELELKLLLLELDELVVVEDDLFNLSLLLSIAC